MPTISCAYCGEPRTVPPSRVHRRFCSDPCARLGKRSESFPPQWYVEMPERAGVYGIAHHPSGRVYVGATSNLKRRRQYHRTSLDRGVHENEPLLAAFRADGGSALSFRIIEFCADSERHAREEAWIAALGTRDPASGFNVRLCAADVAAIREASANGEMQKHIAGRYGVSTATIGRIVRGLTFRAT